MKSAGGAKAAQNRRPRFRLEYAAAFFIAAALLFFLYSVLQAGTGGQSTGSNSFGASLGGSARRSLVRMGTLNGQSTQTDAGALLAAKQPPCPEAKTNTVVKQETVTVTKLVYGSTVQNPRAYHVVTTTQGFSNHWQARIHYYWYKKQRDACLREPACDMGGFTRVLHSGKPDDLMDEIPTVVVDPLPPSVSGNTTYVVLNRPYAFIEWLTKVSIPEVRIVGLGGAVPGWPGGVRRSGSTPAAQRKAVAGCRRSRLLQRQGVLLGHQYSPATPAVHNPPLGDQSPGLALLEAAACRGVRMPGLAGVRGTNSLPWGAGPGPGCGLDSRFGRRVEGRWRGAPHALPPEGAGNQRAPPYPQTAQLQRRRGKGRDAGATEGRVRGCRRGGGRTRGPEGAVGASRHAAGMA